MLILLIDCIHICLVLQYDLPPFRAIGQLFMDILHFKELGDTEIVVTNAVLVFIWSLTIVCMDRPSDALPLFKILKQ